MKLFTTLSLLLLSAVATAGPHPTARTGGWQYVLSGRRFRIFAPGPSTAGCPPGVLHPVILGFHGRNGTAGRMRDVSHFHVEAPCSIVLYPEGTPSSVSDPQLSWQPAPYANPASDDLGFVNDILNWVSTEYSGYVDMTRVYASGKSNGASLVAWLACRLSSRLTAIAPVSGPFYLAQDLTHPDPTCSPTRAVPVINFHGTEDSHAPYSPTRSSWNNGTISTVQSWVQWWATRNGCGAGVWTNPGRTSTCRAQTTEIWTFTGCNSGVEVVHHKINHGLHDWQSLVENPDNTDDESNPSLWMPPQTGTWCPGTENATPIILEFFNRFHL